MLMKRKVLRKRPDVVDKKLERENNNRFLM